MNLTYLEEYKTKVGVASGLEASILEDARYVIEILQKNNIDFVVEDKLSEILKDIVGKPVRKMDVDILILIGSDRYLLKQLLEIGRLDTPILPLSSKGQPDFLFEISATSFDGVIEDLQDDKSLPSSWHPCPDVR